MTDQAQHVVAKRDVLTHLFFLLMGALVAAFFAWAHFGQLDVVANALGEVIPSSKVKSVQHLEGGIVRDIHVREGERVKKDQPLVTLDPLRSGADVSELEIRLRGLRIEIVRLQAESNAQEVPIFPRALRDKEPDLVARARALFETRMRGLENKIESQTERIEQRKNEIDGISLRIANSRKRLRLVNEQIEISDELMKDQLTNRMQHLNLLKEAQALKARISEDSKAKPRAQAGLKASEADLRGIKAEFLEEVRETLRDRRREEKELAARLEKFQDTLSRTVLRSPVDGIVKTLHVATLGGVVTSGRTVVDVVPAGDRLIVEAQLPTQDIGYVRPGQSVLVSLSSPEAIRFGRIEGEVVSVSPDTIETDDGTPFYNVRVATSQSYFESGNVRFELVPGVQVLCAIQTGQRSVLAYLLDPFLKSGQLALRER